MSNSFSEAFSAVSFAIATFIYMANKRIANNFTDKRDLVRMLMSGSGSKESPEIVSYFPKSCLKFSY